jgi:hypothetical protein
LRQVVEHQEVEQHLPKIEHQEVEELDLPLAQEMQSPKDQELEQQER